MKKKKLNIWTIILIVIVALALAKDFVIKMGVETAVRAVTGLPLKIDRLHVGLTSSLVDIKGLKVHNPKGFEEKVMVNIPEIFVDYNLMSVFTGKIVVTDLRIHLAEMIVVKNKEGDVNLDHLKQLQQQQPGKTDEGDTKPAEKKDIQIDNLTLRVDRVVYKDYSKGAEPTVKEFKIGIDQSYKDINNLNAVVSIIVVRALAQTTIANLTNLDISELSDAVSGTLKGATDTIKGATDSTKKVLGDATDTLKDTTDSLKDTTDNLKDLIKNPFGK